MQRVVVNGSLSCWFPVISGVRPHTFSFGTSMPSPAICVQKSGYVLMNVSFTAQQATLLTAPYYKETSTNSLLGLLSGKVIKIKTSRPLIADILCHVHGLISGGISVDLCGFLVSHVGLAGD